MSDINISVQEIKSVHAHPNADKLEITKVLGTQVVVGKGEFSVGDKVVYFPPDMLIPTDVSERLGVQKYLKHAVLDGEKVQCRIAACRLRGIPSYGFVIKTWDVRRFGTDVTTTYKARKYEPPVKFISGDAAPPCVDFPKYTNIQHYWQYPDAIPEGTPVRITEKLHGTNSRVGIVKINGVWTLVAGSHNLRIKPPEEGKSHSRYWRPLENDNLRGMLVDFNNDSFSVVVYGEIFGPGVQDMDYGLAGPHYRVYDITINGEFLPWDRVKYLCYHHGVPVVPLLYVGPFSADMVERRGANSEGGMNITKEIVTITTGNKA